MIGFFDSGLGGLTVLKEVIKVLPDYSYLYLGDNDRTPYGTRHQDEIFKFTLEGVEFLFNQGAKLVVIACNTSSSSALRKIQQEILPSKYPDRKVLGIIVPTAEDLGLFSKTGSVGVLATPATVDSGAYEREIKKFWPEINFFQQACPELVPMIESGKGHSQDIDAVIKIYLDELFLKSKNIDTILLGCTHYALIANKIEKLVPREVKIIIQGPVIAQKLKQYLAKHPELENFLDKKKKRVFFTTGDKKRIEKLSQLFFGEKINMKEIKL